MVRSPPGEIGGDNVLARGKSNDKDLEERMSLTRSSS